MGHIARFNSANVGGCAMIVFLIVGAVLLLGSALYNHKHPHNGK